MDIKICKYCGKENYKDMKFCSLCGKKFENEAEPKWIYCPNCGNKNEEGEKFCAECGFNLEEEEESEDKKEEDTVESEDEAPEEKEKKVKWIYCPNCGNKNEEGEKFCAECGFNLEEEVEDQEEEIKEEESEDKKEEDIAESEDEAPEEKEKPKKHHWNEQEENKSETKESKKLEKIANEKKLPTKKADKDKNKKKQPKKKSKKLLIIIILIVVVTAGLGISYKFGLLDSFLKDSNSKKDQSVTDKMEDGWSEWMTKLPENINEENYEIEEKNQYSKQTKKTKTSTSETLEGWTLYDTKSSDEEKTEEVETEKKIKAFESKEEIEIISKETILEKYEAVLCGYYNPTEGQNRFYTPNDQEPYCDKEDSYTLEDDDGEWPAGTYKVGDDFSHKAYTNSDGTKIYYKVIKVTPYKVKYTYKDSDSKTTYYFYKWTSWSKYQDEKIEEDENTKVRTRTVYRYKEK